MLYSGLSLALSLGLCLAVVETFARWREQRLAGRVQSGSGLALVQPNPHGTGSYRLRPNLDLATTIRGQATHVRTNRFGMHWREVERDKPAQLRRVAFLGDSFTFGCWTPSVETSFVGVFENGLNRKRIEALNFGVGGYGLLDMELLLKEEVLSFEPDWVVVAVFVGNDFRDTYLGLDKETLVDGTAELDQDVLRAKVPQEFLNAPYEPSPPAPDPSRLRAALERLATFRLLLPAFGWNNPWIRFKVSRKFTTFTFWSQQPPPPIVLRARDDVLLSLQRMDALVREHGGRLAVVTIPMREQVYCNNESGADFDVQLPQAWVRVFAREQGIPYLDLWVPLRQHALETGEDVYLADDIHFSERGHALAGTWIREWFQTEMRPTAALRPILPATAD